MLCFTAIALGYLQYLGRRYRPAPADSADMAEKGWKAKKTLNNRSWAIAVETAGADRQNHYSDAEKRRIADDYHAEKAISGVTIREFAVRLNIQKSTLGRWFNMPSGPPGIRKKRPVRYPKMEVEVYQFTLAQRALELELRNIDLQDKARKIVSVKHPQGDKQGMPINLTIAPDGTKFPAEIVFNAASKSGQLSDNFVSELKAPSNVIIRSARKAWWSSKFEKDHVNRLFPAPVNRGTSVLFRDHFSVHVMEESTELLLARNVQQIIIPLGMTGQPLDVSVNKPFKESFKSDDSEIEDGNGANNSSESDEEMDDQ
ncbi:hypothetical protein RvY_17778 [Ramazzottius varieornatus]|uniref:DDE-1 domain-containing protein n=1 Tax=Ramazzottius varieornatus TaxID=947166 RepID=A0A1D1W3D4_RAMVA|nr:hypothetical protein RvY_17778 [Ramazzottius varieornatus]